MSAYDNIKRICGERGISMRFLEREAGLSNGAISKWADSDPQASSLKAVADVLKVKMEKLLE